MMNVKIYSSFEDNISVVGFADLHLITKYNKGICFLWCIIDIFSKIAWIILLKDEKGDKYTIQKIIKDSICKPNKV